MLLRKNVLLYCASGVMELSWFFAWAMFASVATLHRPFPFFESILGFVMAVLVTRISTDKGWRVVQIAGLQAAGFTFAALVIAHRLYYASDALYSRGWLVSLFAASRDAQSSLILIVNIMLMLALWAAGVTFARRAKTYYSICGRFDFGVVAFFVLFVARLIAVAKGGVNIDDSLSLLFLFPFFLFSLLSIGMARIEQRSSAKSFLPGYQGVGVILSFIGVVLVGAGSLVLFFLPGLTVAAQMSYRVLKVAGRPLGWMFISAVRFMLMPRGNQPDAAAESSKGIDWQLIKQSSRTCWGEILEKILGWGLMGLVLLLLLVILAISLFYVFRWLFSRTSGEQRSRPRVRPVFLLVACWGFIVRLSRKVLRALAGYRMASELYGALLAWARHSGFPHVQSETPSEFGMRLNNRFPELRPQIELIVSAYNRETYGEMILSSTELSAAQSAWRLLRSPLRWPSRARSLLFKLPPQEDER